ncbi:hypothetical protein FACS1894169_12150 [Bacteroidia bacterium]|nr:hypothetical protein FACS1894169_12150 [Bacteroidia bacterium]
MLIINGLLRAIALPMTGVLSFDTAPFNLKKELTRCFFITKYGKDVESNYKTYDLGKIW